MVLYPSRASNPATAAQAGQGKTKKMYSLEVGYTHAKKEMTAKTAPEKK